MRLTPKEKADELVLRYLRIDNNTKEWFNLYIAKQCALIVVMQILEVVRIYETYYDDNFKYWIDVKQEIEKI